MRENDGNPASGRCKSAVAVKPTSLEGSGVVPDEGKYWIEENLNNNIIRMKSAKDETITH